MKTKLLFFLFLVTLFQANMSTYAIELKVGRKIALRERRVPDPHRSVPILPTAFIDGSLLSIDFPSAVSTATITVRDAETGEIVYSSTDSDVDKVEIDMIGVNPGRYVLEIVFPTATFTGDFEL